MRRLRRLCVWRVVGSCLSVSLLVAFLFHPPPPPPPAFFSGLVFVRDVLRSLLVRSGLVISGSRIGLITVHRLADGALGKTRFHASRRFVNITLHAYD
jgi:hypothetical protein